MNFVHSVVSGAMRGPSCLEFGIWIALPWREEPFFVGFEEPFWDPQRDCSAAGPGTWEVSSQRKSSFWLVSSAASSCWGEPTRAMGGMVLRREGENDPELLQEHHFPLLEGIFDPSIPNHKVRSVRPGAVTSASDELFSSPSSSFRANLKASLAREGE